MHDVEPDSTPTHPETPRAKTASQDQPAATWLEAIACFASQLSTKGQEELAQLASAMLDEEKEEETHGSD